MGRIDQAAPGSGLQADFEHVQFGGVDDQRQADDRGDRLDDLPHGLGLVGAFGQGGAQVQAVGAAFHLLHGQGQDAVVIFGQDHLFEVA